MKKEDYKKIIRDFLNGNVLKESNETLPLDNNNTITNDSSSDMKININKNLEDINEQSTEISKEANMLLNKISASSQTWKNVFNAVEDLRKNFRGASSLDTSADPRQIGMASVLLILFELVVQTNLRIQPVDINIIINTLTDNFTDDSQIEALKEIISILNIK